MDNFVIFVLLMSAAFMLVDAAQWLRIPYPIVLVVAGGAMSFIPGLPPISYDPQLALKIILPPIIYYSAFWTSFNEFKKNSVDILSLSLGLVIATTALIGILCKWLFPEISWALAFAFGAIVSPPDAIAATSILRRFSMRSRIVSVLEGESLVNDAVALILYRMAVVAMLTGIFSWSDGLWDFTKITAIGGVVGLVGGYVILRVSNRLFSPILGVIFSFVVPYLMYIWADAWGGSGILAVVIAGLILSRIYLKHLHAMRRLLAVPAWDIVEVVLNCVVFLLIGYQLKHIVGDMSSQELLLYSLYSVWIMLAMIIIRFIWVYATRWTTVLFTQGSLPKGVQIYHLMREGTIIGWSGMRGIVSLIAVLALPVFDIEGTPIVGREAIIFMTFMVILLTLVIPGLSLPYLLKAMNICAYREGRLVRHYRRKLFASAVKQIESFSHLKEEERDFLQNYFHSRHRILDISLSQDYKVQHMEAARRNVVQAQRAHLIQLWQKRDADEKPLKFLELELDLEEAVYLRAEIK